MRYFQKKHNQRLSRCINTLLFWKVLNKIVGFTSNWSLNYSVFKQFHSHAKTGSITGTKRWNWKMKILKKKGNAKMTFNLWLMKLTFKKLYHNTNDIISLLILCQEDKEANLYSYYIDVNGKEPQPYWYYIGFYVK